MVKDTADVVGKNLKGRTFDAGKETNLWCDYLDGILRRSQRKPSFFWGWASQLPGFDLGRTGGRVPVRLLVTCLPWGAVRSSLRMRRPIGDLLSLYWQVLGRGVLWQRQQAQAQAQGAGAGAGAGESPAVESRAHVTGGEANTDRCCLSGG